MKRLTPKVFNIWLETYSRASRENDPQVSAELFAQDAKYYETPFGEPLIGREAIRKYWEKGAQTLKDKRSAFEILAVKANLGIARWQSNFTVIESNKHLELDCLFVVEFDDDGLCQTFREWWHIQEVKKT